MTEYIAERRDIQFALFEQLKVDELTKSEKFKDLNKKTMEMIVSEARNFGVKEILPTYAEGDKQGVSFEKGEVKIPECYRRPFELLKEGEWTSMTEPPELGGQGVPEVISTAVNEFILGANFSFACFGMLAHGAGKMVELCGTEEQKDLFLKKLYTLEWAGTMLLTESGAGSDVGALATTATKNDDGTYSITGEKIFITSGDHDLTENIIHPVLARIEGAPEGTKGISLFIVPKIWVNEDGTLGEPNDIICTGIEEKMGLHGSATCTMAMGSKGTCRGLLLGKENKGLRVMFHMMNEARLGVGLQAFAHGSNAYLYAVNYAKERVQGRDLDDILNNSAPSVPIIRHPDIRRMLLEMKAYVEGMRSFTYYVARCFDDLEIAETESEKEKYKGLIDLLTPVLKAYNSNKGFDVCVKAMQVYGGAGYTKDYPVEQLTRDCKITSIYEGTESIQAMDLLGRKLAMKGGAVFLGFLEEIKKTAQQAKENESLKEIAEMTETLVEQLDETAMHMGKIAMSPEIKTAFAHSAPFLEIVGDTVMAWMLLWRANIAASELEKGAKKKDISFYEGQIKSADYFINNIIPITFGKMNAIKRSGDAAIKILEESFGG